MPLKTIAIISAAGQGKRMGRPKQFLRIGGRPMLWWTLAVFQKTKSIQGIILVINADDKFRLKNFRFPKIIKVVAGGRERQDSVYNGLKALPKEAELVVIHDGARPFVTATIIEASIRKARKTGAAVVGVPVKDTLKRVRTKSLVNQTIDREKLWAAQTPQVFKRDIIMRAYQRFGKQRVTDDAMLVEKMGKPAAMVMGSYLNLKVTTPEDLVLAGAVLREKKRRDNAVHN